MSEASKPTPAPAPRQPPAGADGKDMPKLAPAQEPGELGRLAHYRILKLLGKGGMGVVFLAEDSRLQREVALKVMRPSSAKDHNASERFLREARAAAKVKHDHVVTIYDADEEDGTFYIAMEHLRGAPLDVYLKRQPPPNVAQILRLGRETAAALGAAHERGLVHRDVKPANIWLEVPKGRVKILDFGLAWRGKDETQLTQAGTVAGTPAFMSPEQARGQALDPRSDLFSLGAVLYRLCTGRQPFNGNGVMEVMYSLAMDTPAPPRTLNPAIPIALSDLVMHLLAKKPEDRPNTAAEVVDAIRGIERALASGGEVPTASAVNIPASTRLGNGPWSDIDDVPDVEESVRSKPRASRDGETSRKPLIFLAIAGGVLTLAVIVALVVALSGKGTPAAVSTPEEEKEPESNFAKNSAAKRAQPDLGEQEKKEVEPEVRPKPKEKEPQPPTPVVPAAFPPLDPEWARKVALLPFEAQRKELAEELKRRNPDFNPADMSTGRAADDAVYLVDIHSPSVTDLTPLRALPKLQHVVIQTPYNVARTAGKLRDLTTLAGASFTRLQLRNMPIDSIAPLRDLPRLEAIELYDLPLEDLTPLASLRLREFHMGNTRVRDLGPLRDQPIRVLGLGPTAVTDFSPLTKLPLEHVTISVPPEAQQPVFDVLRKVPTLQMVNGMPAGTLWKALDRRAKRETPIGPETFLLPPGGTNVAPPRWVRFSADGNALLAAEVGGTVRLWDRANRSVQREFVPPRRADPAALAAEFIPKTDLIVVAYQGGEVRFWDAKTGQLDGNPIAYPMRLGALAVRGDGKALALGPTFPLRGGRITPEMFRVTLWDLPDRNQRRELTGHSGPVVSADFSPNGQFLATASMDNTVRVWDASNGRELFQERTHDPPASADFSPDGRHVAVGGALGHVSIYDWRTGKEVSHYQYFPVTRLCYAAEGKYLLVAGSDGWVGVFEPGKEEPLTEFNGETRGDGLAVSQDSSMVATAHFDFKVRLWDLKKILAAAGK
jgi:serine/threonine protein kinase/WD40 repeat protein